MPKLNAQEFHEWEQETAFGEVFEAAIDQDMIDDINYNNDVI